MKQGSYTMRLRLRTGTGKLPSKGILGAPHPQRFDKRMKSMSPIKTRQILGNFDNKGKAGRVRIPSIDDIDASQLNK